MSQKLFVLGLPGSGKSTVAQYIVKYIEQYHNEWLAIHLGDYDILLDMFQREQEQGPKNLAGKHFFSTEHEGFYVKAPFIYDDALKQLESEIIGGEYAENTLVLIEFARSDYEHALDNFSESFLQGAFFLFLDVDIHLGIKRVRDRVKHPHGIDDHFVSLDTFEYYRSKDNIKYLSSVAQHLTRKYGIRSQSIKAFDNRGSEKNFTGPVGSFISMIVSRSPSFT